jgi:hypothetical protein
MKTDSYSRPAASWRDGAHWSPMPWVPTAKATSPRSLRFVRGRVGVSTVPVTAIGRPSRSVLENIIRSTRAGAGISRSGSR